MLKKLKTIDDSEPAAVLFNIVASHDEHSMAVGSSLSKISVFDPLSLHRLWHTSSAHSARISDLHYTPAAFSPSSLLSCSLDGSMRIWDIRSTSTKPSCGIKGEEGAVLTSCNLDPYEGHLLVAGSESFDSAAPIYFYDVRKPVLPIAKWVEIHDKDISQVAFHPYRRGILLTAAVDGLLCISECTACLLDENEALQDVLNADISIAKFRLLGDSGEYIAVISDSDSVSIWDPVSVKRLADFGNVRNFLPEKSRIDYAVDVIFDRELQRARLIAGDEEGNAYILGMDHKGFYKVSMLASAHSGSIRSALYLKNSGSIYTGGEDAKLARWKYPQVRELVDYNTE